MEIWLFIIYKSFSFGDKICVIKKYATDYYFQAEQLLLSELGFLGWKPKHKLWFEKNYSDTENPERIDAEYFQPMYDIIKEFVDDKVKNTELTKKQANDYKKHDYKCYDKIYIPGTASMKRSNNLEINGHTIKMPDSAFKLFMEFVVELKKGKGGWLTKVVDAGKHQQFDRVRKPLEGSLLDKDAKKFIENNGSKQYRISTHPDFVTYDKSNLLKHTETIIQELAKNLPED